MDKYDVTVRAGNSGTALNEAGIVARVLVAGTPLDLTGNTIVFRVLDRAGTQIVRKDTASGITVDIPTGTVTIPVTVAESRLYEAAGAGLRWEVERRIGGLQRTFLGGALLVAPGVNDDA